MIYESRKTWPGRTGLGRSGLLGGAFDSAGRAGMIRKPFGRKRSKVFFPLVAVVFVSRLEGQIVGTFLCLFSPNFEIKRAFTVTNHTGTDDQPGGSGGWPGLSCRPCLIERMRSRPGKGGGRLPFFAVCLCVVFEGGKHPFCHRSFGQKGADLWG